MVIILEKINKVLKVLISAFFILFLIKSISTYYIALAQYGTGDQTQFSLPRIQKFLTSSDSVLLNAGSNLSYIVVGIPGHILEKSLDKSHKKQDKLFDDFQYTEILPYSIIQVSISILLLLYSVFLLGVLLKLQFKKDLLYYLLIALIILNYPTLKGDIKILKYDALSLLCSVIAILNYFVYLRNKKRLFLVFGSIFSGFAFIEKDTCFSAIVMIIFFEMINIALTQKKGQDLFKKIIVFISSYIAIFIITIFIMVPQLWHEPGKITVLFKGLSDYFQVLSSGTLFLWLIILTVILLIIRHYKFKNSNQPGNKINTRQKPNIRTKTIAQVKARNNHEELFYIIFIFGIIIFISAILFQKNNMIDMSTASPNMLNKIRNEQLFTSPVMAQVSISTLDKSEWITRLKVFYNSLRIFIYVSPEIIILLFFFTPLLFVAGLRKGIYSNDSYLISFMSLLPVLLILAYSYLLAPIEPKYNLLSYLLLTFFSIFILIRTLQKITRPIIVPLILLVISLLMIQPALSSTPAYLGYKNHFRSTDIENSEFLDMDKYNWWMWLGWGETTYSLFNYIDKTTSGKQKILLDYTPPFAVNPRFQILYNGYFRQTYSDVSRTSYLNFTLNDFKGFINYYNKDTVNFLIVSKNVANRGVIGNFIIKNFRDKAVFVDKIGGVEYGWLFKIDDLVKIANNN